MNDRGPSAPLVPTPNPDHPDLRALREYLRRTRRDAIASGQRGGSGPSPAPLERWTDAAECGALVLDFDGVMTDNRVFQHQDGSELVACNRSDGMGIQMVLADGLPVVVLSKQKNPVVSARCRTLGVACRQNESNKADAIASIASELGVPLARVAFVGNDVNDLGALGLVGAAIAPADAEPVVLEVARFVTPRPGGRGAVRDVCDHLLRARLADRP
ncbi:MAG: KdsC family phosphatase [Phycisphaerales bacterium]